MYMHFLGLCAWVINIVNFYEVFCDVEPKRKALAAANADLAAAQDKLSKIKAKIQVSLTLTERLCIFYYRNWMTTWLN